MVKKRKPSPNRDRIDLRGDPEWIAEIFEEASKLNMNVSNFIRYCVTKQIQREREERKGSKN